MRESFEHFRIEGILTYNLKEMNKQKPVYQSERQGTNQNRIQRCTQCKKFIQMKNFTRHRNLCAKKRRKHPLKIDSVPVALLEATIKHSAAPQDFLKHILNKLRDDIVGTLCKQDQIIVKLGIIFYGRIKRKKDKKVQVSMQVFYIHDGFSKPFETPSF